MPPAEAGARPPSCWEAPPPPDAGYALPPIPRHCARIDPAAAGHFWLTGSDLCLYVWDYARRAGFAAGPANNLISNLKKKPSRLAAHPIEASYKEQAIAHAARALRSLLGREWIEHCGTLVPVPCSKLPGHPDHDDRLARVLRAAFQGWAADIRPLIGQRCSTAADHETAGRSKLTELLALSHLDEAAAVQPPRPYLVVFDDVLTSGKHFKVAQRLLAARFPQCAVLGLFLARCLPEQG
ncbi:MAG TPA: hypothetical protein VMB48_03970 [Steroidobacteraceae bacterium]|nr:hypothetical protein [Steroidobacteraceae bacterium]